MSLALTSHAESRIEERSCALTADVYATINSNRRSVLVDRVDDVNNFWRRLWWCVVSESFYVAFYNPSKNFVRTIVPYPGLWEAIERPIPASILLLAKAQAVSWARERGWKKLAQRSSWPKVYATFVWRSSGGKLVYRKRSLVPERYATVTPEIRRHIDEMLLHFLAEGRPVHEIRIKVGVSGHEARHIRSGLTVGKSFTYINEFASSK